MFKSYFCSLCCLAACLVLLSGCGGGGGGAAVGSLGNPSVNASRGAVQFAIQWAPAGRADSSTFNSVRVTLASDTQPTATQVISRPPGSQTATTTSFGNLPPGTMTLTANGYSSSDGSGPVLASGSRAVTVTAGQTTPSGLTQTAAISSIQITPTQADVEIGAEVKLTVFAQDSNSNMVLSPGLTWQWSSAAPAIATLTANGETALVHGVALGESTINVQAANQPLRYLITVTVRNRSYYTVADLGTLSGGTEFIPLNINNTGMVVGKYTGAFGLPGGFVWQNGQMQNTIPVKGDFKDTASYGFLYAVNSQMQTAGWTVQGKISPTPQTLLPAEIGSGEGMATSINNSGQAAGVLESPSVYNPTLAVVWAGGQPRQSLPPLNNSLYSRANNINDNSQVAGESDSDVTLEPVSGGPPRRRRNFDVHAVVWNSGQITDICPGYASAVNDNGQVVGAERISTDGGGTVYHAFFFQNGRKTDLGPGEARAINSLGLIVGINDTGAILWKSGQTIDLNTQIPSNSGWILKSATGINDKGQIVGAGIVGGSLRAFVLTPR